MFKLLDSNDINIVMTPPNCTETLQPLDVSDLHLSRVKPLGVKWLVDLYDYMKTKPEIIRNEFKEIGILESATLDLDP